MSQEMTSAQKMGGARFSAGNPSQMVSGSKDPDLQVVWNQTLLKT